MEFPTAPGTEEKVIHRLSTQIIPLAKQANIRYAPLAVEWFDGRPTGTPSCARAKAWPIVPTTHPANPDKEPPVNLSNSQALFAPPGAHKPVVPKDPRAP